VICGFSASLDPSRLVGRLSSQAALLERQEKIAPARAALPIGEIDAEDLPLPVAVDSHRDQHHLAEDHPGLAHLLITRIRE